MATVSDADGAHDHVNDVLQPITNGETGNGVADPSYKANEPVMKQEAHDNLEEEAISQNELTEDATNADVLSGKENLVEATINHTQELQEVAESLSAVDDAALETPDQVAVPEFDTNMGDASQLNGVEIPVEVVPQADEQSLQHEHEEPVATEATLDVTDDAQVRPDSAVDEATSENTKESSPAIVSEQEEISASVETSPLVANAEITSYTEDVSATSVQDPAPEVDEILSGSANVEDSTEDLAEITHEDADKMEATVETDQAVEEKIYADIADTVNEVSLDSNATLIDVEEPTVPVEDEPIHMEEPVSPLVPRAPEEEPPIPSAVEETIAVESATEASVIEPVEVVSDASEAAEEVTTKAAEVPEEVLLETAQDVSEASPVQPPIETEAVVEVTSTEIKEEEEEVQVPDLSVETPVADDIIVESVAEVPITESSEVSGEVAPLVAVQEEEELVAESSEDLPASESQPTAETVAAADDATVEPVTEGFVAEPSEVVEEVTASAVVEEGLVTESVDDLTEPESQVVTEEPPIEPTVEEPAAEEQELIIDAAGASIDSSTDAAGVAIPDAPEVVEVADTATAVTREELVAPSESQSTDLDVEVIIPDATEAIEEAISTTVTREEPPTELQEVSTTSLPAEDLVVEEAQDSQSPIPEVDVVPKPVAEPITIESNDSTTIVEEQTPAESAEASSETIVESDIAVEDVLAESKSEEQAVEEPESSSNAAAVPIDITADSAVEDSEVLGDVVLDDIPTEHSLVEVVTPGEAPEADSLDDGSAITEPAEIVPEPIATLDATTDAEIPVVEATQSFIVSLETPAFLSADGIAADSVVPVEEAVEAPSEEPTESGTAVTENTDAELPIKLELLPESELSFSSVNAADTLEENTDAEPVPTTEEVISAVAVEQFVTEEVAVTPDSEETTEPVEPEQSTVATTDALSETEAFVQEEAETVVSPPTSAEAVEIPIKDEDVEGDLTEAQTQDNSANALIVDSQVSEEIESQDATVPPQEEGVQQPVEESDIPPTPMTDTVDSSVEIMSTVEGEAALVDDVIADSIDNGVEEAAAAADVAVLEETIEEQPSEEPSHMAAAIEESQPSVLEPELAVVESATEETLPTVSSDPYELSADVAVETISGEKVDAAEEILGVNGSESEVDIAKVDVVEGEKSANADEIQVAAIEVVSQSEEEVPAPEIEEEVLVAEQAPQEIEEILVEDSSVVAEADAPTVAVVDSSTADSTVDTTDVEEAPSATPDSADETEAFVAVEESNVTETEKIEADVEAGQSDEEVHVQEPIAAEVLDVVEGSLVTENQSESEGMRDITVNGETSPEQNLYVEEKPVGSEARLVDIPEPSIAALDVQQATTENDVDACQLNESLPEVQTEETSEDHEHVDAVEEEVQLSSSLQIATEIERPKSPWTPSYSVTTQGPGISDKKVTEESEVHLSTETPPVVISEETVIESNNELPVASDGEESRNVLLPTLVIPRAVRPGESLLSQDGTESRPRSPWTPSYSVTRQGSISPRIPEVELPPSIAPGKDESTPSTEVPLVIASAIVSEPLEALVVDEVNDDHSTPAVLHGEVVDIKEETSEREADEVQFNEVEQSHPVVIFEHEVQTTEPEPNVTPSASLLVAQEEPVMDRPKSPWTPSYSVTRQGSGMSDVETAREEAELDKLEQLPEPVANAPEQDVPNVNGVNGVEAHVDSEPILAELNSSPQVAIAGVEIPVTPEVRVNSVEVDEDTESSQAFPTAEDSENTVHRLSQKPSLVTIDELNSTDSPSLHIEIPTSASSRKRLESTTSSRFFPGGWFSSSPKVPEEGRTSLDVAAGEFISKSAETTPTTPMPTAIEEDSEKKARWCTIM